MGNGWIFPKKTIMMIKQTGRLVGACRFVLAGDGLTPTFKRELIDYLDYYNNRRIKAKLKGLPPTIHRLQALSVA